jgi:hypothetical protein
LAAGWVCAYGKTTVINNNTAAASVEHGKPRGKSSLVITSPLRSGKVVRNR